MEVCYMDYSMLEFILRDTDFSLQMYISEVLEDSLDNPDHSAVYASNLIKCYIKVMKDLGNVLPFNDVKGYILGSGFSEEDYELFENSRKKESVYYIGEQF